MSNQNGSNSNSENAENFRSQETENSASDEKTKLLEQCEKAKHDYLYLRAEFDNYKKQAIKERSDLMKYGAERLARDLLGVLDNFERALSVQVTAENFSTFTKGVEMTAQELRAALQKNGIHEVPCEGLNFDPNVHEAISSEASNTVEEGKVLRAFQKGYKYHEKVIRPAHVVVAKKPEA